MRLDLATVAEWTGGRLVGDRSVKVLSASVDTRTLGAGALFVALPGEHFDGHDYVGAAREAGATAALVMREAALAGLPGVVVNDPLTALGQLAHRFRWSQPLIPWVAVTGSNGKTTTREMLVRILRAKGPVAAPIKNFNNLIGLPLTVLGRPDDAWIGVLEMGTNHRGEIQRLTDIAMPTVAVVTSVAAAHLEGLGTVQDVAHEKACIFTRLPHDGLAVFPGDDEHAHLLRQRVHGRAATFSLTPGKGELVADEVGLDRGGLHFKIKGVPFDLPLLGLHNVRNALAAVIAAGHFGVGLEDAAKALAKFTPVPQRLELIDTGCLHIIDDTYNSNPGSLKAAADTLAQLPALRRVAVIGDMLELGEGSRNQHRDVGRYLATLSLDMILAVGPETLSLAESAAQAQARTVVRHFRTAPALLMELKRLLKPGDLVLVKGSRGMHLERIVRDLRSFRVGSSTQLGI